MAGFSPVEVAGYQAVLAKLQSATSGGGGGGGTGMPGIVTPEQYGAVGDDTADDTTAIQTGLDYVKTHGGALVFTPNKTYKITAQLDGGTGQTKTYRMTSMTGDGHINITSPTIHFTGATGSAFHAKGAVGLEMDHLRWTYDPNTFTGAGTYLLNISSVSPGAGDVQPFHIHHCAFNSTGAVNPSNGAASLVRLYQAIIGKIEFCHFGGAQIGLRFSDPGGSYVNNFEVANCTFNFAQDCHIGLFTGDGEQITIRGCAFEDCPANGAIYGGPGLALNLYTPLITENWFGDNSVSFAGPQYWIKGLNVTSNAFRGTISFNRFADMSAAGFHLGLVGAWNVIGNSMEGGTIYDASPGNCDINRIGNYYNTAVGLFPGDPATGVSLGDSSSGLLIPKAALVPYNGAQVLDLIQGNVASSAISTGTYTLGLLDAGTVKEATVGTTITVPPNSSVAFPIGTVIEILQYSGGQVVMAPGAGVTLRSDGAKLKTAAQYATIGLRKRATDEWVLSGDLTA